MFTREELLRSPEYWFENIQNELFRQLSSYLERENITQTEFAEKLGFTKGYVSQVMQGNFNYTLKKLIDLSLAMGQIPDLQFKTIEDIINEDSNKRNLDSEKGAIPFSEGTISFKSNIKMTVVLNDNNCDEKKYEQPQPIAA